MPPETGNETRTQGSLKFGAIPAAVWRSGAYFAPAHLLRRRRGHLGSGIPSPETSLGAVLSVLADELVLAGFKVTRNPPTAKAWERINSEVVEALNVFDRNGWLDDPAGYHRAPEMPSDMSTRPVRGWETLGLPWEQLRWSSGWAPRDDEPGLDRWASYERNDRASAWILRHRSDAPRHWAVLLHGTEQGRLLVDQKVFQARRLFQELGCNVVMPLLPLHATRRARDGLGTGFPTLDVLDNIHGLAQSVFDVRSALAWIATQDPLSVSVTGLSLGGNVAALVAGLEPPLGGVVGLVPAVDFPDVFRRQIPHGMRHSDTFTTMHAASSRLHQVVSPLAFTPATPSDRLYLLAGLHDRLLDPLSQAAKLAEHWATENVTWLDRGHVTHMASPQLTKVVESAIAAAPDLIERPAPPRPARPTSALGTSG